MWMPGIHSKWFSSSPTPSHMKPTVILTGVNFRFKFNLSVNAIVLRIYINAVLLLSYINIHLCEEPLKIQRFHLSHSNPRSLTLNDHGNPL